MSVLCITQHRAHLTAKQNTGVAFLKKEKKKKVMQEVLATSRTQNSSCSSKQDAKQLGSKATFHSSPPLLFSAVGQTFKNMGGAHPQSHFT